MISFEDSVENHKENIEPLRQGRSITNLAKTFSGNPCALRAKNDQERCIFESEIDGSDDLDDPLDVWVKYIKWTNEAYPHGQSAESGLVPLLERCIRRFISVKHYHDDPRYLKVWIQYIKYIDDPQELFCFLAHKGIGKSLSAYYEEYANFLEATGRKSQANDIYKLGIERKAHPFDRLQRRYDEFLRRSLNPSTAEPNHTLMPTRSVLSMKFLSSLNESDNIKQSNNGKKTYNMPRINVYTDSENERLNKIFKTDTWDNIGTIQERKKENCQKPRTWVGEKLPMKKKAQPSVITEKFTVFCDEENKISKEPLVQSKEIPLPRKEEKIMVNLQEIYHDGKEFSLDELKAKAKGLLGKTWEDDEIDTIIPTYTEEETTLLKDSHQTSDFKKKQASPTINTKAALADIFDIFSKPLKCEQSDNNSDEDDNEALYQDDSAQEVNNTTWNRVSSSYDCMYVDNSNGECKNVKHKNHNEDKNTDILGKNNLNNENLSSYNIPSTPSNDNASTSFNTHYSSINPMASITEDIELILPNQFELPPKEKIGYNEMEEPVSSPFQESVSFNLNFQKNERSITQFASFKQDDSSKSYIIKELVCNPLERSIRDTILSNLNPPIHSYDGLYNFSDKVYGKLDFIDRFNKQSSRKSSTTNNQETKIKLAENNIYRIKKKLGEGAFAPVYLAENTNNSSNSALKLRAIKIERSTTPWEFYIIQQAKYRLGTHRVLASIIDAYEMHIYHDVGFLIMKYRDQGTILDLVNIFKSETGNGIDEVLAIFFTIELLRTLEQLHNKGILHGDLKPDNCLLRLDPLKYEWLSKYQRDGSGGWASKGIVIIDFGKGIDLKMFSPQVQFIADWVTDEQDCAEMREARPWTYQVDYHGLATIIHTLLFGKHIETIAEKMPGLGVGRRKYRLSNGFKRYWQQDIWKKLFDLLLNPVANAGENGLPITKNLKQIREEMETWLIENCEKGVGLKASLWKIETLLHERK
ncbi:hypothetical protein T552_00740 [Pneumocystis carinii B80]|uniref:BUB protein kinase n=1 Tax=Pneumocystis carinii (strain B80) TaxID=1408658 RepID=A0A0W4ZPI3_PNEC8|nr:hypothetical protein T552_00740 [Pneumocystis carinii B80]KTW30264.1 hypothetical protein T552_00740 [Pneumocystis carinii B80]